MPCLAGDSAPYTSTQHRSRPMTAVAERLNKATAATYLGVSERTLDLWRAQDRGPRSHKIGGRLYWLRTDCDEWLNAQLIETARGGVR